MRSTDRSGAPSRHASSPAENPASQRGSIRIARRLAAVLVALLLAPSAARAAAPVPSAAAAPAPAVAALSQLSVPRAAPRHHASDLHALAEALAQAARRLDFLAARITSGGLVGFVIEARELEAALPSQARDIEARAASLETYASSLEELATSIETQGRHLCTLFVASAMSDAHAGAVDDTFVALVDDQRALRRRTAAARPRAESPASLTMRANGLAATPARTGTTAEARTIADEAIALVQSVDAFLASARADHAEWRLAYVNEAVALLATESSREARSRAYALTSSVISDVRNELAMATERMTSLWKVEWAEPDGLSGLLLSEKGRERLVHLGGVLALIALGVFVRRCIRTSIVALVRAASRWRLLRGSVGTLVRLAGLLQMVLPVLVWLPVFYGATLLLGREDLPTELAAAIFYPFFLYALGRVTLIGSTRQITRGRPALIPLREETRARLVLTYARLGLIFAVAAGFLLKDVAESFVAGIAIIVAKPFQVDDRITFGGYYGEVVEIGLRTLKLVTLDDNLVTVPTSQFSREPVASTNAGALECMVVIPFYLSTQADHKRARDIVHEAVLSSRYLYPGKPINVLVRMVLTEGVGPLVEITAKAYVCDTRYEKAFASDVTDQALAARRDIEGMLTPPGTGSALATPATVLPPTALN